MVHRSARLSTSLPLDTRQTGTPALTPQPPINKEQAVEATKGSIQSLRIEAAASGTLTDQFWEDATELFRCPESWGLVADDDLTERIKSTAFALVTRAAAGVHFHLDKVHKQGFYKLWKLLGHSPEAAATEIWNTPRCMRDKFTNRFLSMFPSVAALCSDDCAMTLAIIAISLRLDISRIECRHAWVRRVMLARSSTHGAQFGRASSDFVMMRCRQTGSKLGRDIASAAADSVEPPPKRSKPTGGPQRAYFSEEMAAGRTDFTVLHPEYKAILEEGGERYNNLVAKGHAATQAGREGVRHVFGQKLPGPSIVPPHQVDALFGRAPPAVPGAGAAIVQAHPRGLVSQKEPQNPSLLTTKCPPKGEASAVIFITITHPLPPTFPQCNSSTAPGSFVRKNAIPENQIFFSLYLFLSSSSCLSLFLFDCIYFSLFLFRSLCLYLSLSLYFAFSVCVSRLPSLFPFLSFYLSRIPSESLGPWPEVEVVFHARSMGAGRARVGLFNRGIRVSGAIS